MRGDVPCFVLLLAPHARGCARNERTGRKGCGGIAAAPLGMAHPLLLVKAPQRGTEHGFAPHGSGRIMSRTARRASLGGLSAAEAMSREVTGIDARL